MLLNTQMTSIFERFSGRPALADRRPIPRSNGDRDLFDSEVLDWYETLSYEELRRRVLAAAAQLHGRRMVKGPLASGDRLALLGFPGIDFTTIDFACNLAGVTTVPLQTSGSLEQHRSIIGETSPRALVISISLLNKAESILSHADSIDRLIVLDYRGGDLSHRRILESAANSLPIAPELLELDPDPGDAFGDICDDHLSMLLYTSGSTGAPKGAMYSARLVREMWGGEGWSEFFAEQDEIASFHYMPMSHVAGHSSVRSTLSRGGVTYFSSTPNLANFFDDLALARPTELSLVPRVCELLHQEYQRRAESRRDDTDGYASQAVLEDMRTSVLGGRVEWASCTSAPVSAELKAFMERLLGIELHELYGTTEIGGVLADGRFLTPPVIDYRLDDVPELGYFRTDRPSARGELLVKSTSTVPGYFNRPDLNAEIFTEDGYYRTGDIAAVDSNGTVRIIDRKNSIIKLSQGEFVALPSLEATFVAGSTLIRQVFLYGRSDWSALVAVVVPTDLAQSAAADDERNQTMAKLMLDELRHVAEREHLNSYEVPAAVIVESEPFSEENGLLSDHRKPVRPRLHDKYQSQLEAIYEQIVAARDDALTDLIAHGAENDTASTIRDAAALTLQIEPATVSIDAKFRNLGGDSLTAVHLSRLLNQIYGLHIPVDVLVSEARTFADLGEYMDGKRGQREWLATFEEIHTSDRRPLYAEELTVERFLSSRATINPSSTRYGAPQGVLITGASGFLGRFLCLEWLRRFAGTTRRVTCLVRANSHAAARARLRATYSSSPELLAEFDRLAGNLDVVAGDLAEPRLGLDEQIWKSLSQDITHIIHAGAMVNHALGYRELFASNVAGTAEVLHLALTGPLKRITFMSSIATALLQQAGGPMTERVDIREALSQIEDAGGIVDGYAATKWASEVLLRNANEQFGVPVTVFRSSMILAHSRYRGQINVPDTYTRLLFSVLQSGITPSSFYAANGEHAHYDGLPVDVVSEAIASLAQDETREYRTYHLVNPFDDGISLDRFVEWLIEAGVSLVRVGEYGLWMERFKMALSVLDDDDKRASLLPLIDGFRAPEDPVRGSRIDSTDLHGALAQAGLADRLQPLSREFVLKSVRDIDHVFGTSFLSSQDVQLVSS
ncbi:thioester reductase domain-containing protein [Brevibacterium casei]|nr:thioester reductase domain-containing protein [Brevibacterium casei]MCT1447860.1 thioester reductase domain-containing protein [Brevibacterium casei]